MNSKNLKEVFFLITIGVFFVGLLYILAPYLGVIFISIILVELFYPWYKYLKNKFNSEKIATLFAGLSVILTVVIPITIVLAIVVIQANSMLGQASEFWQSHDVIARYDGLLTDVNSVIAKVSSNPQDQITNQEIKNYITAFTENFLNAIIGSIETTVSKTLQLVTQLTLFIISIFTLFKNRDRLYQAIKDLSPLEDDIDSMFIRNFIQTAQSVIKGTFLIALAIGTVGGILFWILGIEAPVFWGLMMTVFSIVPIGSGIVWIPASIYLVVTGEVAKAIILFVSGIIMTNPMDTMLRGRLTKAESLPPLLLAFTILGGLQVFGILGFLYGPLIAVFFIALMQVYKKKYQ